MSATARGVQRERWWRRSAVNRTLAAALAVSCLMTGAAASLVLAGTDAALSDAGVGAAAEASVMRSVRGWTFLGAVLCVLATGVFTHFVATASRRPLRATRLAAERFAAGDLNGRIALGATRDERALASAVNGMVERFQRHQTEQESVARQQHQFVSDVAHELRTPLTTVRMAADVIYDARAEFSPVTARSAELLSREVDRFEELLNDLLDLSRIDAGAAVLAAEECDVVQLVCDELESQLPLADTFGSELVLDAPPAAPAVIDQLRVRRIVTNLLSNAIEHGEGRLVEVHVRRGTGSVAIAVRDHGVGLSASDEANAFTRFWRGDPSRYRAVGGAGLGLAIARENAELHGGRLEAWGRPGGGAQFCLTLPLVPGGPLGPDPWPRVPPDAA